MNNEIDKELTEIINIANKLEILQTELKEVLDYIIKIRKSETLKVWQKTIPFKVDLRISGHIKKFYMSKKITDSHIFFNVIHKFHRIIFEGVSGSLIFLDEENTTIAKISFSNLNLEDLLVISNNLEVIIQALEKIIEKVENEKQYISQLFLKLSKMYEILSMCSQ